MIFLTIFSQDIRKKRIENINFLQKIAPLSFLTDPFFIGTLQALDHYQSTTDLRSNLEKAIALSFLSIWFSYVLRKTQYMQSIPKRDHTL